MEYELQSRYCTICRLQLRMFDGSITKGARKAIGDIGKHGRKNRQSSDAYAQSCKRQVISEGKVRSSEVRAMSKHH